MNNQNMNVMGLLDSYLYTQKNMTGELVRYKVDFFPNDNDKHLQKYIMASGLLIVSPIIRKTYNGCWENTKGEIQQVYYPVSNVLPSFEIIDNLNQPDRLEGFKLEFFDYERNLLRTELVSIEEWLFLIGEIHQLYCGYLQIDVSGHSRDLLVPQ